MAWRDSRSSRRRLLLFSTSIILGIAALVAISSFGHSLQRAVDSQAKALVGSDLVITSRDAITAEEEAFLKSLGGARAQEVDLSSMIYFPTSGATRLVQLRALSGDFPFYGTLETEPAEAAAKFRQSGGALVDETLLIQYNAKIGDPIRLGELTTFVAGALRKAPGESLAFATISPRVYLPLGDLPKTALLKAGSLVRYRFHYKFPPETNVEQLVAEIRPQLNKFRLGHLTVEMRKRDFGRSMDDVTNYLGLVGFIALLLGGVGVASAIHVHVKQKLETVAVLRCLGSTVSQTFAIYLLQGAGLGVIGALTGAALGVAIQTALPKVMADLLSFPVTITISWPAVWPAMAQGFVICLLFALLPLLGVRRASPLAALRSAYESDSRKRNDPLLWLLYLLIAAGIVLFCLSHTRDWRHGLGFAAALAGAFGILWAVARLIVQLVKKTMPARLPYVYRQGLANLHRPDNRTVLLMLSLGLGTFLVLTLYLVQAALLKELVSTQPEGQANVVLFDIQSDQRQAVAELIRTESLSVLDEAAVVTMRIRSIKGRSVEEILGDANRTTPNWVLRREYRSTYRNELRGGEKTIAGQWPPPATPVRNETPISLEQGIARELNVRLGDELVFDVQGVPVTARVAALREVDWRRVQPNFFVIFPTGVLEEAPAFHVLLTRVHSAEQSAALQRAVVQNFPNVSAIDLSLILQTLDSVLSKISFVIRFMALFTIITGLLVLAGALVTGRYQRIRESILLRTLGASRAQILKIQVAEYASLGLLAALTGIVLALAASWALSAFIFKVRFVPSLLPLAIAAAVVSTLTVFVGLLICKGISNHPPLQILRAES